MGDWDEVENTTYEDAAPIETAHIQALHGGQRSRPLRVVGLIQDRQMSVLIDTGSDRDFLHPQVAEALHLPLSPIRPFRVLVGNGEALLCTHVARQTKLVIQGTVFMVDLHILPIHGPDIILGMDWLESLGKITADFAGKTLEFRQAGKTIVLKGILPPPRQISLQSLLSLIPARDTLEFYEVLLLQPEQQPSPASAQEDFPPNLPPSVAAALERYRPVFSVPEGMPPRRPFDHRVHLLPGTNPIDVRPYRYPYFQKTEIERQVREMFDQGIIRRSSSPFSSPVLLIRKEDGTFRF